MLAAILGSARNLFGLLALLAFSEHVLADPRAYVARYRSGAVLCSRALKEQLMTPCPNMNLLQLVGSSGLQTPPSERDSLPASMHKTPQLPAVLIYHALEISSKSNLFPGTRKQ